MGRARARRGALGSCEGLGLVRVGLRHDAGGEGFAP